MTPFVETLLAPTGRLVLDVWRFGKCIEHFDEPNLIVNNSKSMLASLLGGATTNNSVSQIGYGTNSTTPALTNTALSGAFLKNLDSITYPAFGQVQFNFSLATTEANGLSIIEFGLLTPSNTLFSRRVRATAIVKDSTISFTGNWTVQF